MAQNLAQKYSDKVDERFIRQSFTEQAVNKDYSWVGVVTVQVYSVDVVANGDYSRTGSTRYGTAAELGTGLQALTLAKDRSFTFTIDKGNHTEEMMVTRANRALRRQLEEVMIPEIDTYRIGVMSAAAIANGHTATEATTASNAYAQLLAAGEALSEDNVPTSGRIAFVTPAFYSFLKLDNSFIRNSELGQKMLINGQVGEVDGVKIVMVPSSYFPANHAFVMCHPVATVSPKKLEDYKIHDNPPGINGKLVEGRCIYDAFVLDSKVDALYAHKIAV